MRICACGPTQTNPALGSLTFATNTAPTLWERWPDDGREELAWGRARAGLGRCASSYSLLVCCEPQTALCRCSILPPSQDRPPKRRADDFTHVLDKCFLCRLLLPMEDLLKLVKHMGLSPESSIVPAAAGLAAELSATSVTPAEREAFVAAFSSLDKRLKYQLQCAVSRGVGRLGRKRDAGGWYPEPAQAHRRTHYTVAALRMFAMRPHPPPAPCQRQAVSVPELTVDVLGELRVALKARGVEPVCGALQLLAREGTMCRNGPSGFIGVLTDKLLDGRVCRPWLPSAHGLAQSEVCGSEIYCRACPDMAAAQRLPVARYDMARQSPRGHTL